ncbi:MAG: NAD(P)H-binding protein [Alphaproteobacteria bacterium]|nr:NAD(P)H-binding protein [Alphaproteobacteria bacterium]
MTQQDGPILVLGATGKTGRRVVERLRARGLAVRPGARGATPAFDWTDPASWAPALAGARAVYIAYHPDLAVPGAPETVRRFADLALAAGARRLVLLSGRGEEEAERAESLLAASGADWTILRASWFAQNFSESFLADAVRAGEIALPVGDAAEPFIDADDIADVAAAALSEPGHIGRLYELTGPRLLTFDEATQEIADATGRAIRFTRPTPAAYRAALAQAGTPNDLAELLIYLFTTVLDGRNARTADGVAQALGRPARDFRDYARRAAAAGAWEAAA